MEIFHADVVWFLGWSTTFILFGFMATLGATLFNGLVNHPDFSKVDWKHLKLSAGGGTAAVAPDVQTGSQEIDETMTVTYEVK